MSASIKITLYSDEGPTPTIVGIAQSPEESARIEWAALVGTAEHLLRNHRERMPAPKLAALETLVVEGRRGL